MTEYLVSVTSKGQITLPAEIRRALGISVGDKVAISLLTASEDEGPQAVIRRFGSVAEMTFGAVPARKRPEDFKELRRAFEEGGAIQKP